MKLWNLWVVKGAVRKRLQRKLGCWVESRTDAEVTGGLFSLLLSQRVVHVYDIVSTGLGQGLGQLVPMCCCFRASFPFNEVLECSGSSMTLMVSNLLHFVEFFSSDKVRWRSRIVWSVGISLHIRG